MFSPETKHVPGLGERPLARRMNRTADRLIVHVDVDAFFASVEQLLIPALRGRCVIVGSGCIASCSYEARAFGLHAGMPLSQARRLCPQVVVLEGHYQIYRCFAEHIWDICRRYTTSLETFLDEAYGDATGMEAAYGPPLELGRSLQRAIRQEVHLPVSVGLAGGRMMAKLASSSAKPNGVAWIQGGQEEAFLAPLPIEKLLGVGGRTAQRLHDLNIQTIGQLRNLARETLRCLFGRRGEQLYDRCRGIPDEPRRDPQPAGPPRTISRETTFHEPTGELGQIRGMLEYLSERAVRTARSKKLLVRTVELAIRYDDWKQEASSASLAAPTARDDEVFAVVLRLLERLHKRRVALRHVGVTLSNFVPDRSQPMLFDEPPPPSGPSAEKRADLYRTLDAIRDRWGHSAVVQGESINLLGELKQNDYGFILRTPSLTK